MLQDKDDPPKVSEKDNHVNADDTASAAVTLSDKPTAEESDQHKSDTATEIEPKENASDGTLVNAIEFPHLDNQTEKCEKLESAAVGDLPCGKYYLSILKMLEKLAFPLILSILNHA